MGSEDEVELVGIELRMCFSAGKPQRPIRSCSSGSNWPGIWSPGRLPTRAPRIALKS